MKAKTMSKIGWNIDNSYAGLPESFYSSLNPISVSSPKLIILNDLLADSLGLNVKELQSEDGLAVLAGNKVPESAFPIAQAYAGHQFGHFTMLGDGRAILLGEQITPLNKRFDIQLKGSGKTPYSRGGDGRASLGPMLREYIISEAMNSLGIPTTRSLAVITTGESITRETQLLGAILTRVASSHIRVGTFQYIAKWGTVEELKALADYTIQRHFPEAKDDDNPYLKLLHKVIKYQAFLIAKWQLVGFIHGVMNTDNMAISGETIDYGPCAFMNNYDPETVFSSIDIHGRYAYCNQPLIGEWNLGRFAEALLPLLHEKQENAIKLAQDGVSEFNNLYNSYWISGMRAKLGLFNEEDQDKVLIDELLSLMEENEADYTNTFISLTFKRQKENDLFENRQFNDWYKKWQSRLSMQKEGQDASQRLMMKSNPGVIPRNHRVEEALESAVKQGDYSVMKKLLDVLECPFAHSPEQDEYSKLPPPSSQPYRTFCGT